MFYWALVGLMFSSITSSFLLGGYFFFFNKDYFFLMIGILLLFLGVIIYLESENLKYSSMRRRFKSNDEGSSFPKESKLIASMLLLDELSGKTGFKRKHLWNYKDKEIVVVISFKKYVIYYESNILYKKSFSKTNVFKSGPWVNEFIEYVKSLNVDKITTSPKPKPKHEPKVEKIYEEINF